METLDLEAKLRNALATRSRDTGCALEEVRLAQFTRGLTSHHSRFTARRVDSHYLECRGRLAELVSQIAGELKAQGVDLFEALVAIRRTADSGLACEGIGETAKAEVLAEATVWVVGAYNNQSRWYRETTDWRQRQHAGS